MKKIYLIAFILTCGLINSLLGQCYLDRHNTSWNDGWLSCEKRQSPNAARPSSHWIQYALGNIYQVGDTYLWNYNDPTKLNAGAKDIAIDYSLDGITWKNIGQYTIPKANGNKYYEGTEGPNLGKVEARYILITVLSTYGDNCAGIAELKFDVQPILTNTTDLDVARCIELSVLPNPFVNYVEVKAISQCSTDDITIAIYDGTGRMVSKQYSLQGQEKVVIPTKELANGLYFVKATNDGRESTMKVIKIE